MDVVSELNFKTEENVLSPRERLKSKKKMDKL